ncbi:MAG: KpsF/GutQ family sugar-phosphate isomerase [Gemmataceae bacterium]|nr:KpsF/GutQ family sugar-phosphate isomerase [Gemmataceae bacterium]
MNTPSPTPAETVAYAQRILRTEAAALEAVAERLGDGFTRVAEALFACQGRVAVIGVGKSADVGQKTVGTLNSTGTRAYTLDATKAVHGDLGSVHPDDVALLLSHSGESEEIVRLLNPLRKLASGLFAITSKPDSTLARAADAAIVYGPVEEACPLALAPSSSTTVMLALGDALAFTLLERRRFTHEDFARFHPAGSLGRKLAIVSDCMRTGDDLRIASQTRTVREVFAQVKHTGRRTGAIMLVDADGRLAGLFTDSDLARLFENRQDHLIDAPISQVMTHAPTVVAPDTRVMAALDVLRARKFSELPVVDAGGRPVGMLDITDLIGIESPPAGANSPPALRLLDRKSA